LREKKYDLASKKYDLVLEKYPDSPVACDAQYRMAGIFFEKGNFEQAIIAYQSVLGNFSGTSLREKTVYSLGVAYFKKGDYQSSEEEFKKLLRDFSNTPLAPRARFYLGSCLYSMGRYDEALEAFKNSSRSFTDRGIAMRAKYQSGWCYYNMHKDQEAVSEFNEFLRRYPDTPLVYDAKFWLGEYYTSKAKYEKAREYFLFVFEKCREDGMARQALYNLSMTYYWEGRYDDAAIHLEGFALKYPGTELAFSAYRKIARIKKDKRDLDGAVVYLRRSLTGKDLDSDAQARYEIAECLEERGDLETAVKEYLRVSRDYPDRVFWVVRSDLRCAIIFEKLNRLKDALVLYERLSDMDVEESKFARERLANLKYKLNPKLEAQRKKSDHETAHNLSALS
jgi:TolA-binding protein